MTNDTGGFSVPDEYLEPLRLMQFSEADVFPLVEAAGRSEFAIGRARELLGTGSCVGSQEDMIGFGSLARYELTENSDLDYLMLVDDAELRDVPEQAIAQLRQGLVSGIELSEPGDSGLFGCAVGTDSFSGQIGLEQDTNKVLTRRVLLLEESVSLCHPDVHRSVLQSLIGKYLDANPDSARIPRYLLNDLIRYWRTITIDYQAKIDSNKPRALRYLKLLIPRKLTFVSSLAPLIQLEIRGRERDSGLDFLVREYSQPSSLRLLRLLAHVSSENSDSLEACRGVVLTLNRFIECSGSRDWREAVEVEAMDDTSKETDNFGTMRDAGKALHEQIGAILNSTPLRRFSQEYLFV